LQSPKAGHCDFAQFAAQVALSLAQSLALHLRQQHLSVNKVGGLALEAVWAKGWAFAVEPQKRLPASPNTPAS
jgi:hypothetical protein